MKRGRNGMCRTFQRTMTPIAACLLLLSTSMLACGGGAPRTDSAHRALLEPRATAPAPSIGAIDAGAAPLTRAGLDKPLRNRGPIRVRGYSRIVGTGMNDPADRVGFSTDGASFGYCMNVLARDPPSTFCSFVDAAKQVTAMSSETAQGFSAAKKKAIDTYLAQNGIPRIASVRDATQQPAAPKLEGEWDFDDVEIVVNEHGQGLRGATVLVGGAVDGEAPVFPYVLAPERPHTTYSRSWVNGFVLSPSGTEMGLVAGFFCQEWCDDFLVERWNVGEFVSRVYNDAAMRHHDKGEYARSGELFTRAVSADPSNALATYNLACALARQNDPRAEETLDHAIRLGGANVRTRAARDADFESVRHLPWFTRLVAHK